MQSFICLSLFTVYVGISASMTTVSSKCIEQRLKRLI